MEENKISVKIKLPDHPGINEISRDLEIKQLKEFSNYIDVGWKLLGLPFDGPIKGRDSDGDLFDENTDIWLKTGDHVKLTYYHGFGPDDPRKYQRKPVVIGEAIYTGMDQKGHWFDIFLDPNEPLAQRIIKAGPEKVRGSSGSVSHLVRRTTDNYVEVWPIGELSLFDVGTWRIPANDYAVVVVKSKQATEMEAEAVQVKASMDGSEEIPKNQISIIQSLEVKMTENTNPEMEQNESQETEKLDFEEIKESIAALAAEVKALRESQPVQSKGGPTTKSAPKVVESLGEPNYRDAFFHYIKCGETDKLIKAARAIDTKAALNEATAGQGGYLVPNDEHGTIIGKRGETSIIDLLGIPRVETNRDIYNYPTEDTSMTKFTIVAEAGAISGAQNEPTFGQKPITLYNLKKLIVMSEEIAEDENSQLASFLNDAIGRSAADTENYYALIGTGSSQPQGAFVGGTAGLTLDSATAIGAAEVPELLGKLKSQYHPGSVLVMNPATWFYLRGLTGNQFIFSDGVARSSGTIQGPSIDGYPVVLNSNVATIASTAKTILVGNFQFYGFVQNRGFRVRRLTELYAGNGQIGILANFRFGGAVLQAEAFQYATQAT